MSSHVTNEKGNYDMRTELFNSGLWGNRKTLANVTHFFFLQEPPETNTIIQFLIKTFQIINWICDDKRHLNAGAKLHIGFAVALADFCFATGSTGCMSCEMSIGKVSFNSDLSARKVIYARLLI